METSRRYRLHDDDAGDDLQEGPSTCLFFCFPCPPRRRQHGGLEHRSLLRGEPPWWEEGPPRGDKGLLANWQALLRRLRRRGGGRKRRPQQQLQYDPVSYALNFDDGAGRGEPAGPPFLAGFSPGPPSKGSYI